MAVVNNFIDDFVDQDKVFPDSLLIDDSAIISKDLHHPVDNIMHKTWRDVVLGGGDKVDTELLGEHVVEAINVERWWRVSLTPSVHLPIENFTSFSPEVLAEISQNYGVASAGQYEELR